MDPRSALDILKRRPRQEGFPPVAGKPRFRFPRRYIPAGVAAIALIGIAVAGWLILHPAPLPVTAADVIAEGGDTGSVLNATGTVVAQMQATIAAQVTGMVTEVYVHEGDHVTKGQVVARLDDRSARASTAAAAGTVKAYVAEAAAYAALADRYHSDLRRQKALAAEHATSAASVDEADASYRYNRALSETYRGLAEQSRHNFEYYRTQQDFAVIRAPFAGVVTERYAHPGEMISPQAVGGFTQTGICTIVDMSSLEVDVDVGEAFIARLHAGQTVAIVLDAYPDQRYGGHVITIVPTANQQKATVRVRVAFDAPDARILPQMNAQVWFEAAATAESPIKRLFVPSSAIVRERGKNYVFRIDGDVVHKIAVQIRPDHQGRVRVLSGLQAGERVVTSDQQPLEDGRKVQEHA